MSSSGAVSPMALAIERIDTVTIPRLTALGSTTWLPPSCHFVAHEGEGALANRVRHRAYRLARGHDDGWEHDKRQDEATRKHHAADADPADDEREAEDPVDDRRHRRRGSGC